MSRGDGSRRRRKNMNLSRLRFEALRELKSKAETRLKKEISWDDFFGEAIRTGRLR